MTDPSAVPVRQMTAVALRDLAKREGLQIPYLMQRRRDDLRVTIEAALLDRERQRRRARNGG